MTIGNRIKALRTEKKLSQEYLAEKLGVSRQAVSKWESGASSPSTDNLIALAAHCTGIFTGEFDRSLNGVLWIGCGDSPAAIALNILTVVFTVGWVSAAAAAVYLRK